jgi:hypothetical protein
MMFQRTQTLNLSPFSNQRDHGQRILSPQILRAKSISSWHQIKLLEATDEPEMSYKEEEEEEEEFRE